jgi:predicted metalloprotease
MRWKDLRRSENVDDQRRVSTAGVVAGGGGIVLILALVVALLGGDPRPLLQQAQNAPAQAPKADGPPDPAEEELKDFTSAILGDTEDVWGELFRKMGKTYEKPRLVLFSKQVRSACGFASAAVGPFYCPGDQKVYLDLSFFQDLRSRYHAPGEFAQAYVIAHEIGHHVQDELGITGKIDAMRGRVSKEEANRLSVRLELQADFLAGVWAHHAQKAQNILEKGDVETALRAAAAIGDDRLQREARGYVVPDSFTHGTSAQRVRWFRRGLETGDMDKGDTFAADEL